MVHHDHLERRLREDELRSAAQVIDVEVVLVGVGDLDMDVAVLLRMNGVRPGRWRRGVLIEVRDDVLLEELLLVGGQLAVTDFVTVQDSEAIEKRTVRFRTIGDATCTGAVESRAATLQEIIDEIATARVTERGTRADDQRSETAMEDRKKEGYF